MVCFYWKLEGHQPIPCPAEDWGEWFNNADRRVAGDRIAGIFVSTVFLGLNHNFSCEGDPLLFETMLFTEADSDLNLADIERRRYSTWDEAEAGHQETIERLQSLFPS